MNSAPFFPFYMTGLSDHPDILLLLSAVNQIKTRAFAEKNR